MSKLLDCRSLFSDPELDCNESDHVDCGNYPFDCNECDRYLPQHDCNECDNVYCGNNPWYSPPEDLEDMKEEEFWIRFYDRMDGSGVCE